MSDLTPETALALSASGRTLLAELEALRELERVARDRVQGAVPEWAPEIRSALAAVDAARKGAT